MLPQLDSSHYFSQFFWLSICLIVLVIAFKKCFIPRFNALIENRDKIIGEKRASVTLLENKVHALSKELSEMRESGIKQSAEIIRNSIKKSEKTLNDQMSIIREENEQILANVRKKFDSELRDLESNFKVQIDIVAQSVFDKLFQKKESS